MAKSLIHVRRSSGGEAFVVNGKTFVTQSRDCVEIDSQGHILARRPLDALWQTHVPAQGGMVSAMRAIAAGKAVAFHRKGGEK